MIIHINQTLQSYLVHEKKTIYFLEHAGTTSGFRGDEAERASEGALAVCRLAS